MAQVKASGYWPNVGEASSPLCVLRSKLRRFGTERSAFAQRSEICLLARTPRLVEELSMSGARRSDRH